MHFADAVLNICQEKESRLVVGLDPHWHLIPQSFKASYKTEDLATLLWDYFSQVVNVTLDHAVMFKPQIAFFEQYGIPGLTALQRLIRHIQVRGGTVLMDAKRNDIGSTAAAYARTFFGENGALAAFPSHALTVNGYLGSDGLNPFLANGSKGLFVLVKTSNPSSGELQDLELKDGRTVAAAMADQVETLALNSLGTQGYGNVGAVVGATYPDHMRQLRSRLGHALLLVPGYGAQGGDEAAVAAAFDTSGKGALINSSRAICFPSNWQEKGFAAIAEVAARSREHINQIVKRSS